MWKEPNPQFLKTHTHTLANPIRCCVGILWLDDYCLIAMYCRHSSQVHGDICEDWLQYWSVVMSILWCARCYGAARSAETLFMMIAEDFVTASKQKLSSKSGIYVL